MEQYIPKSALVAETDRRLKELYSLLHVASKVENGTITVYEACNTGKCTELESFRKYIDTIEVKDVDLEKEIETQWNKFVDSEGEVEQFSEIAKHFFELGLNTQHSSINISNIDHILEESGIDPLSKEAKIFKESYYMALEKIKAQKGESYESK